jgi:hypothetical protein
VHRFLTRLGRSLLLAVCALGLSQAREAGALSCWQCEGARETCNYYTRRTFARCEQGCGYVHPNDADACADRCREDRNDDSFDCLVHEGWCYQSCEEGPGEIRPLMPQ